MIMTPGRLITVCRSSDSSITQPPVLRTGYSLVSDQCPLEAVPGHRPPDGEKPGENYGLGSPTLDQIGGANRDSPGGDKSPGRASNESVARASG